MIRTLRLELRPGTEATLTAELEGRQALAAAMQVIVPENWPPPLYDEPAMLWSLNLLMSESDRAGEFNLYHFIDVTLPKPTAIGIGGFKGPPAGGRVEIGYSVLPQFQRNGYATEAVSGMIRHAFLHPDIQEVIAETLPHLEPSIGVLSKNGFTFAGDGSELGIIRFSLLRSK